MVKILGGPKHTLAHPLKFLGGPWPPWPPPPSSATPEACSQCRKPLDALTARKETPEIQIRGPIMTVPTVKISEDRDIDLGEDSDDGEG